MRLIEFIILNRIIPEAVCHRPKYSDALEVQVAKQVEHSMMPVHGPRGSWNLIEPCAHHVGKVGQGPKNREKRVRE